MYSYKREVQFTGEIESCVGMKDAKLDGFNPIVDGRLKLGTVHTNAYDVKEICPQCGLEIERNRCNVCNRNE